MTREPITPWSQVDDESDVSGDRLAGSTCASPPDQGLEACAWATDAAPTTGRLGGLRRTTPFWALAPLAGAACWLMYLMVINRREAGVVPTVHAIGILALILAAGVLLFLSGRARRTALAAVYRAIAQNTKQTRQAFEALPIAAELKPLWEAVNRHTHNIENRMGELLSEHKQLGLELSLTETQRRQGETILQSIQDPVLVTDALGQLAFANSAAEAVFGFEAKSAIRQPIVSVLTDQKLLRAIQQVQEAEIRAANRRTEREVGGRVFAVTLSALTGGQSSSAGPTGSHGVVVLLRDITKDREATKMKSEFVARVAHELRTPLSSIRAYVEMLVDGEAVDEKTRKEYYDIIQVSADRLGRMIDNVLNISRIEAGTVRIKKEAVAVSMIVKEAGDVARPQAEAKQIVLTEDLSPVAYRVMADRDMINQAVLNLLSNAIKYTPEGGKVHVRMAPHEENHTIGIEVSDTGVGIPKEDLPRMFEKFFRVEANKKMAKGTGLGLNLVKHIVETIHEGSITVTSEVDKGSTFAMVLPLIT